MAVQRSSRSQPSSSPVRSTRLDRFGFGPQGDCCMLVRCKGASTALLLWHLRCSAICSSLLRSACRRPQSPSRSPNAHVRCSAAVSKRHTHSRMPTGLRRAIIIGAASAEAEQWKDCCWCWEPRARARTVARVVSRERAAIDSHLHTSAAGGLKNKVAWQGMVGEAGGRNSVVPLARFGYTTSERSRSRRQQAGPCSRFSGLALETHAPASSSARRLTGREALPRLTTGVCAVLRGSPNRLHGLRAPWTRPHPSGRC